MAENKNFEEKEKVEGNWKGSQVKFNRVVAGHRFTDEEVVKLLNDEVITVSDFQGKNGPFAASGKLENQEYNGRTFVGFKMMFEPREERIPDSWAEHVFTEEEKQLLESGESIWITNCISRKGNPFSAEVVWAEEQGRKKIIPINFGN